MKILVVEDEALTAMLMKALLGQLGHTDVYTVASGERALSFVAENPPQLIFMDVMLAGALDGIETTLEITKIKPIPVIYTTAYQDTAIRERAEQSGAVAYLTKPISGEDLERAIRRAFPADTNSGHN